MKQTKLKILKAGIRLWKENPNNVSAFRISKEIGMANATVHYHFPNGSVKDAVAAYAVETGDSQIIAQLITAGHIVVAAMDAETRQFHLTKCVG